MPENFNDPQALVKSYEEAQRKISEQGRELAEARDEMEQIAMLAAQLQTQPQQQYTQDDPREWWNEQFSVDPAQAATMLAQQIVRQELQQFQQQQGQTQQQSRLAQADLAAKFAEDQVAQQYPDFRDYSEKVWETIRQNPSYLPDDAVTDLGKMKAGIEHVYKALKFDELNAAHSAQQDATAQAEREKLAAQSASGAGLRPLSPDAQKAEWDRIRQAGETPYWASQPR